MSGPPPVDINISQQALRLTECLLCRALIIRDSFPAHQEWHAQRGDYGD